MLTRCTRKTQTKYLDYLGQSLWSLAVVQKYLRRRPLILRGGQRQAIDRYARRLLAFVSSVRCWPVMDKELRFGLLRRVERSRLGEGGVQI